MDYFTDARTVRPYTVITFSFIICKKVKEQERQQANASCLSCSIVYFFRLN